MTRVADASRFTHQVNRVSMPFLNYLALIIRMQRSAFTFLLTHAFFTKREAFSEVLGDIADHMRLTYRLDMHNIGYAMPCRAPCFFQHLMGNEGNTLDEQMPVKAVLIEVQVPFQHTEVFDGI